MNSEDNSLSSQERDEIIRILKTRFEENIIRHKGISWEDIIIKIETDDTKIRSLYKMEATGGEPDVVLLDGADDYVFIDCSAESPNGRRSLCYDHQALEGRKDNKPVSSAVDMANEIGAEILTEAQYRQLQKLGKFDTKTSSWVKTPDNIRTLGGAIFCDRRYDTVFVYHNGAESYYSVRGFRCLLKL